MFRFVFFALAVAALTAPALRAQTDDAAVPLSAGQAPEPDLGVPADPVASSESVDLPESAPPQSSGDGAPEFYQIRPGDTLTVSVLEDPNLTRTVLVRPDGRISLPIAGSVVAEGVSPENLESILQRRFSRGFQITPTVTVAVRGLSNMREEQEVVEPSVFYIMGSVGEPGPRQLPVDQELTVLEALAIGSGPTPFAAKDRIQIRRTNDETGEETIMLFDYTRLEDGEPLVGNIPLEEGDIIYVPERGLWD